jgi:hypothetical protein
VDGFICALSVYIMQSISSSNYISHINLMPKSLARAPSNHKEFFGRRSSRAIDPKLQKGSRSRSATADGTEGDSLAIKPLQSAESQDKGRSPSEAQATLKRRAQLLSAPTSPQQNS